MLDNEKKKQKEEDRDAEEEEGRVDMVFWCVCMVCMVSYEGELDWLVWGGLWRWWSGGWELTLNSLG